MCSRKDELQPGAYVQDTTTGRMYEVASEPAYQVKLIDAASNIDAPKTVSFLTANAISRFELVRHAPCMGDTASIEEWGAAG